MSPSHRFIVSLIVLLFFFNIVTVIIHDYTASSSLSVMSFQTEVASLVSCSSLVVGLVAAVVAAVVPLVLIVVGHSCFFFQAKFKYP